MPSGRQHKDSDDEASQNAPPFLNDRKKVYESYAATYQTKFRAAIDYQHAEEPRQVTGAIVLTLGCLIFGFISDLYEKEDVTQSLSDFDEKSSRDLRIALFAALFTLSVYCFLQTRDGLLVRPHPGFWRVWHAVGLCHLIVFAILAAIPVSTGRRLVAALLFRKVTPHKDVFAGTLDLQCQFSLRTLRIQMSKMWFTSHIIGWFAKMCIFRDWKFCTLLSLAFETLELSFQWLIPELKECWWDSLILDVVLSNTIGMLIGVAALRLFNSIGFDWMSPNPNQSVVKRAAVRFLPFTWSQYHWSFFRTHQRLLETTSIFVFALATELNTFLIMYALDVPASSYYHPVRATIICFVALSAVTEMHNFVNQEGNKYRRFGHNTWLYLTMILVEVAAIFRYGKTRFVKILPDFGVLCPWIIAAVLALVWCFAHFYVVGPERLDYPRGVWQLLLRQVLQGDTGGEKATVDSALALQSQTFDDRATAKPPHKGPPDVVALKAFLEMFSAFGFSKTDTEVERLAQKELKACLHAMRLRRDKVSTTIDW